MGHLYPPPPHQNIGNAVLPSAKSQAEILPSPKSTQYAILGSYRAKKKLSKLLKNFDATRRKETF